MNKIFAHVWDKESAEDACDTHRVCRAANIRISANPIEYDKITICSEIESLLIGMRIRFISRTD